MAEKLGMENLNYSLFKETECDLSLDEKKWISKCRADGIYVRGNF